MLDDFRMRSAQVPSMSGGTSGKPILVAQSQAPAIAQQVQFKVELDDRAILLPDGKIVQHLILYQDATGAIALDGMFAFNRTQRSPRLISLSLADAGALAAELVAAVYAAKTSFVFGERFKITITVVANGYRLEVTEGSEAFDLFLSTGVIWRVIKGLLGVIDASSPGVAN